MKENEKEKEVPAKPTGPIKQFFHSVRDRLGMHDKRFKKTYVVTFGIFHDGQKVSSFEMKVKANGRDHAWKILANYVEIRPTKLILEQ